MGEKKKELIFDRSDDVKFDYAEGCEQSWEAWQAGYRAALDATPEAVQSAGTSLSNIAFNLAQDHRLPERVRASLDCARKDWDKAIRAAPSPTAGGKNKA